MKNSLNRKIEEIYKQIGDFGPYQLLVFILVGITAFIPAIVGYSYSFYAAQPDFRCKIPNFPNDTYEISSDYHQKLVNTYIPLDKGKSFKGDYDQCHLNLVTENSSNATSERVTCKEYVYSKLYFDETLITDWNMVCDQSARKSHFATLYFTGLYGVLLSGVLSDKFGRKQAAYFFVITSAIFNILLAILINVDWHSNTDMQQILFGVLRLLTGISSNVYSVAVVLAVEIVGPSKRVTAANFIYYAYIAGELVVVFFAYFIRNYRYLVIAYSTLLTSFAFFFWLVPESPRWLLCKGHESEAYYVFKRIVRSNKRPIDCLDQFELLKDKKGKEKMTNVVRRKQMDTSSNNQIVPDHQGINENTLSSGENNNNDQDEEATLHDEVNDKKEQETLMQMSFWQTLKLFFKSRKLIVLSLVTLLNWLTNTLVYYGISFNTTELVGSPYLNFTLSILVEFAAILTCQFTLERFGRKIPYSICMALSGITLLFVQFIPNDMSYLVTVCALAGKYCISFTYNAVYIITAEMYPTVIRNSSVSICQTFARLGAVISPYIQLLGDRINPSLPFIVWGSFSTLSALTFITLMPETKNKKLPDTIEEFIAQD